jgi:hypothetical protein
MTPKDLESLENVLKYLSGEEKHLEEYLFEGSKKRDHIQYHIERLWKFVERESAKVVGT